MLHVPLFGDNNERREADRGTARCGCLRPRRVSDGHVSRAHGGVRARFATAVAAVASAPAGCVLVHRAAGVDRAGLVAALLLRLAQVSIGDVAAGLRAEPGQLGAARARVDRGDRRRARAGVPRLLAAMPGESMRGALGVASTAATAARRAICALPAFPRLTFTASARDYARERAGLSSARRLPARRPSPKRSRSVSRPSSSPPTTGVPGPAHPHRAGRPQRSSRRSGFRSRGIRRRVPGARTSGPSTGPLSTAAHRSSWSGAGFTSALPFPTWRRRRRATARAGAPLRPPGARARPRPARRAGSAGGSNTRPSQ